MEDKHRKQLLFVVNPISGNGRKGAVYRQIEESIDKTLFETTIRHTKRAGHAEEMARKAVEFGFHAVVAVGGDGTINEVARAVVHTPTALGIVPCGSGNGLARHLQIPLDAAKAIRTINQDTVHCLDYGRINGRPFFCTCGVGFDAFISAKFADSGRRGPRTYVENVLKEGLKYKPVTYTIEDTEGTERHEAFLIACANASQYGNNAYIAPEASMKDGLMDIIIMKPFNALEAPQVVVQLFNRTLTKNSHIETFKSKKIRITRPTEGVAHCDGDPFVTGKEIEVEIVPHSFHVMVNPNTRERNRNLGQIMNEDLAEWWKNRQAELKRGQENIQQLNRQLLEKLRNL